MRETAVCGVDHGSAFGPPSYPDPVSGHLLPDPEESDRAPDTLPKGGKRALPAANFLPDA